MRCSSLDTSTVASTILDTKDGTKRHFHMLVATYLVRSLDSENTKVLRETQPVSNQAQR